jgi:hydroxymethyl cephem carbamoyltransferase
MALAGLASSVEVRNEDAQVVDRLLDLHRVFPFQKDVYAGAALHNCGLDNPRLWAAAAYMTGRIFEAFRRTAAQIADAGSPLVISGGCGLNCTWNEQWRRSGLFNDVFVPPCTNDSGSAIGTAIDAQVSAGGDCRIEWSVYAGSEFVEDVIPDPNSWRRSPLDFGQVAQRLHAGEIVAWVQGKSEIGPRALGNRSLLASPLTPDMRDRLNALKGRESYRPIAPCCRIEEHDRWFSMAAPDPHMLFFGTVRTNALPAITHVDGTARVQAVSSSTNAPLHHLLTEFGSQSGYGVLCNTSLNFPGVGFINRLSDLTRYCETRGLTTFVAGANTFTREGDGGAIESGLTTLASNERSLVGGGATNAPPR